MDRDCGARPFDDYLECVYQNYPNRVSSYFARFVGEPKRRIDFIGKLEHMNEDFSKLAASWDLGLNQRICDLEAINKQSKKSFNPALRSIVYEAEKAFYLEFGYSA